MRIIYCILALLLAACGGSPSTAKNWIDSQGKLKILSTTAMISDLVAQVGGDKVAAYTLIQGNLDPHSYQLVKGDDEKLSNADLVFYNGLGLEHGAGLQYFLEHSPKAHALGDAILKEKPEKILTVHNQHDPHIWLDVSLFGDTVPTIVKTLQDKDPQNAVYYAENGARLSEALENLHAEIKKELQAIPQEKRYLVTSHDAFNYFTRAYLAEPGESREQWELRFQAPEGLAPDTQISSADVRQVIDHIARFKISCIFPESNVSRDSIKKIVDAANEKGIKVNIATEPLYGDALGGGSYVNMLKHNADMMKRYLP